MERGEGFGVGVFEKGVVDPLDGVDESGEGPSDGEVEGERRGHRAGDGSVLWLGRMGGVIKTKTAWGMPTPLNGLKVR